MGGWGFYSDFAPKELLRSPVGTPPSGAMSGAMSGDEATVFPLRSSIGAVSL